MKYKAFMLVAVMACFGIFFVGCWLGLSIKTTEQCLIPREEMQNTAIAAICITLGFTGLVLFFTEYLQEEAKEAAKRDA